MKSFLSLLERKVYQRELYVDTLYTHTLTNQIVFVVGSRRVGKSSLVAGFYQKYQLKNILYLNLEFDSNKQYHSLQAINDFYDEYVKINGEPEWIVIDEIQYIPDRQYFIRARYASGLHKIIITGSHSSLIHNELSTYFTGRYIAMMVYPLSYREFLAFKELDDSHDLFEEYKQYGGLPEVSQLAPEKKYLYLKQTLQSLLFEDMMKMHRLSDAVLLEKIIAFIADSTGSELSINSIVNYLKQSQKTSASVISPYINSCIDAFLLHKHDRYDIRGKKILEFYDKYYFYDHGMRNILRGMRADDSGKVLENIVCNELLVRGYEVQIGKQDGYEIDFVATKEGQKSYIQVAQTIETEETYAREFGNLERIRQIGSSMVISQSGYQSVSQSNIPHYPIRKWLLS